MLLDVQRQEYLLPGGAPNPITEDQRRYQLQGSSNSICNANTGKASSGDRCYAIKQPPYVRNSTLGDN
jgi:hypothetical protein